MALDLNRLYKITYTNFKGETRIFPRALLVTENRKTYAFRVYNPQKANAFANAGSQAGNWSFRKTKTSLQTVSLFKERITGAEPLIEVEETTQEQQQELLQIAFAIHHANIKRSNEKIDIAVKDILRHLDIQVGSEQTLMDYAKRSFESSGIAEQARKFRSHGLHPVAEFTDQCRTGFLRYRSDEILKEDLAKVVPKIAEAFKDKYDLWDAYFHLNRLESIPLYYDLNSHLRQKSSRALIIALLVKTKSLSFLFDRANDPYFAAASKTNFTGGGTVVDAIRELYSNLLMGGEKRSKEFKQQLVKYNAKQILEDWNDNHGQLSKVGKTFGKVEKWPLQAALKIVAQKLEPEDFKQLKDQLGARYYIRVATNEYNQNRGFFCSKLACLIRNLQEKGFSLPRVVKQAEEHVPLAQVVQSLFDIAMQEGTYGGATGGTIPAEVEETLKGLVRGISWKEYNKLLNSLFSDILLKVYKKNWISFLGKVNGPPSVKDLSDIHILLQFMACHPDFDQHKDELSLIQAFTVEEEFSNDVPSPNISMIFKHSKDIVPPSAQSWYVKVQLDRLSKKEPQEAYTQAISLLGQVLRQEAGSNHVFLKEFSKASTIGLISPSPHDTLNYETLWISLLGAIVLGEQSFEALKSPGIWKFYYDSVMCDNLKISYTIPLIERTSVSELQEIESFTPAYLQCLREVIKDVVADIRESPRVLKELNFSQFACLEVFIKQFLREDLDLFDHLKFRLLHRDHSNPETAAWIQENRTKYPELYEAFKRYPEGRFLLEAEVRLNAQYDIVPGESVYETFKRNDIRVKGYHIIGKGSYDIRQLWEAWKAIREEGLLSAHNRDSSAHNRGGGGLRDVYFTLGIQIKKFMTSNIHGMQDHPSIVITLEVPITMLGEFLISTNAYAEKEVDTDQLRRSQHMIGRFQKTVQGPEDVKEVLEWLIKKGQGYELVVPNRIPCDYFIEAVMYNGPPLIMRDGQQICQLSAEEEYYLPKQKLIWNSKGAVTTEDVDRSDIDELFKGAGVSDKEVEVLQLSSSQEERIQELYRKVQDKSLTPAEEFELYQLIQSGKAVLGINHD